MPEMSALFDDLPLTLDRPPGGGGGRRRTDPESLLDGLNAPQREAVDPRGSPLLIVAGAGSGKTRVLTRRIAYLLAARDVHPGAVLAITFTNKAAGEMKERVAALVGRRANAMWVSTFHSACVRILRREAKRFGFTSSFTIYDQADSQRLMTLVCRDLDLDPQALPAAAVQSTGEQPEERADRPRDSAGPRCRRTTRRPSPRRTGSTSVGWPRPTPSTSTTSS